MTRIVRSVQYSADTISSKLSSGVIAGLVVEAVVAVLAAAAAFFFYRHWRAALTTPRTFYTPLHRSPGTTTATATGIAPSLETGSNPSSRRNDTSFQPLAAVGRSPQQLGNNGAVQDNISSHAASRSLDSRNVAEGVNSAGQPPNEVRKTPRDRLFCK